MTVPQSLPPTPAGQPDLVFLEDAIPGLVVDLRYAGHDNFLGRPVRGYEHARAMLSRPAASALRQVQTALQAFGLGLKLFDAYRPQRAVDDFVHWADDHHEGPGKARYYPGLDKSRLLADGYIAAHSSHSRASAVDVSLVGLTEADGHPHELDMGTPFDYFGPESAPHSPLPSRAQRAHRALLQAVMSQHGFTPYAKEWWHFTLAAEPYPDSYFDVLPWG